MKAYDPNHRLTPAEETKLLEAAIQSPTSFNIQNWQFVVVRDPELRRRIRAAAVDQAKVTDASLLIVLTADLEAWRKSNHGRPLMSSRWAYHANVMNTFEQISSSVV